MPKPTDQPLKEGDAAPEFSLPASTAKTIGLKDFRGKQAVVLYFYPKDDTPGCTVEAKDFSADSTERVAAFVAERPRAAGS